MCTLDSALFSLHTARISHTGLLLFSFHHEFLLLLWGYEFIKILHFSFCQMRVLSYIILKIEFFCFTEWLSKWTASNKPQGKIPRSTEHLRMDCPSYFLDPGNTQVDNFWHSLLWLRKEQRCASLSVRRRSGNLWGFNLRLKILGRGCQATKHTLAIPRAM